jgi:hypothetical protein
MTEESESASDAAATPGDVAFRKRLSTVFGWVAGGSLGLLINYVLFLLVSDEAGQGYPTVPTTFVLFVAGAFGGMAVADRAGDRAFRPLGIAAGILLSLFLALVAAVLMSPPATP